MMRSETATFFFFFFGKKQGKRQGFLSEHSLSYPNSESSSSNIIS